MANGNEGVKSNLLEKARQNPWILTTIFLVIVLFVVLIMRPGASGGAVVSEDVAAQNLLSFIKAQGGGEATLVSTEKNGSFYQVVVDYQGQEVPVYVTLDGNSLVPSLIPLSTIAADSDTDVSDSDTETETPTAVAKSDKPKVELFVMALCPYGTQAEKGILPVAKLLGSKIDFSIKFVSYAMHGKTEIDENTLQYCIQKEQPSKFFGYLECYLKEGKTAECLTSTGIDKAKSDACVKAADKQFNLTANFEDQSSWLSGRYPMYNVHKAENTKYSVQGSPTLVVNGAQVSSARDSASLLKAVCAAFNTAPEECSDTLSSAAPSAGFGYTAASGTTGSATCG